MPSSLNGSPRGLFLATLSSAFVFLLGASPSASLAQPDLLNVLLQFVPGYH
ncbi:uncharacterized protein DS421_1g03180 [Arachis hypogaea]|nr:uncharacterized protein DS421_1g03180 [Arachis hypogaea]